MVKKTRGSTVFMMMNLWASKRIMSSLLQRYSLKIRLKKLIWAMELSKG